MAVPIVTSQASIDPYAEKTGFAEKLADKTPLSGKRPHWRKPTDHNDGHNRTRHNDHARIRRSDTIIGLGRCIDFCEIGRLNQLSGYVSEMKHVVESRWEDCRATQTAAPTRKLRHLNHANPGHYRCSGILPKRSPSLVVRSCVG